MSQYDVLCLPGINGEIILPDGLPLPQGLMGQKVGLDSLVHDERQGKVSVRLDGTNFELNVRRGEFRSGGSSINLACGLRQLGRQVLLAGPFGDDGLGMSLRTGLSALDIDVRAWPVSQTASAVIIHHPGEESTILGCRPVYELSMADILDCLRHIQAAKVLATGVRPMELQLVEALFRERSVSALNVFVPNTAILVERYRESLRRTLGVTHLLQVNEREADLLLGAMLGRRLVDHAHDVETLCDMVGVAAIITCGGRGAWGAIRGRDETEVVFVPAVQAQVVDTTGAGDGFLIGFLLGFDRGLPFGRCLEAGAWVAARNIEAEGGHGGMPSTAEVVRSRILEAVAA